MKHLKSYVQNKDSARLNGLLASPISLILNSAAGTSTVIESQTSVSDSSTRADSELVNIRHFKETFGFRSACSKKKLLPFPLELLILEA